MQRANVCWWASFLECRDPLHYTPDRCVRGKTLTNEHFEDSGFSPPALILCKFHARPYTEASDVERDVTILVANRDRIAIDYFP